MQKESKLTFRYEHLQAHSCFHCYEITKPNTCLESETFKQSRDHKHAEFSNHEEAAKMETFRETLSRHTKIVGLKWNKLENRPSRENCESPVTRSMSRRNALGESTNRAPTKQTGMLKRARSMRDAFGTLRQVR